MVNIFNKFFKRTITILRQKTATTATIKPATRLIYWPRKGAEPPPEFRIKKIDLATLRKAIKRMKGKRVHISAPLIEDSLHHLVNLSIENQNFATPWKPQLILPFHKKKEKTKVENYRPVSHLVEVGKLVEYIFSRRTNPGTLHNKWPPTPKPPWVTEEPLNSNSFNPADRHVDGGI